MATLKLDDLLGKKKEALQVLDLSQNNVQSKEEFDRLLDKVPEYKIRPEKVSLTLKDFLVYNWFILLKSFSNREHEIYCIIMNFIIWTPSPVFFGKQIKKDEMSKARGACEGEERCMQRFGWWTWGKGTTWKG